MPSPSDERFAVLCDPDLYDFMGRLALKITRNKADADDVRNGAYDVALHLILAGRGWKTQELARPWMCEVLKNHAKSEWRKKQKGEQPVDPEGALELPDQDHRMLLEQQDLIERQLDAMKEAFATHPELAARIKGAVEGTIQKGAAQSAAERKRYSRARLTLAMAISAVVAALLVLFLRPRVPTRELIRPDDDSLLINASRKLAFDRCARGEAEACLFDLEQLGKDPAEQNDPRFRAAWEQGIKDVRANAMGHCEKREWQECLFGLDVARHFDPDGEKAPNVALGRRLAEGKGVLKPPEK